MELKERVQAGVSYAAFGVLLPPLIALIPAYVWARRPSGDLSALAGVIDVFLNPWILIAYGGIVLSTFLYGFTFGMNLLERILEHFDA